MKYLFSDWDTIERKIRRLKNRLILFDLDGTLAPIAGTPNQAHVSRQVKNLMREILKNTGHHVGVLSGRSVLNTERKVGVPGLIYSGNHGLEIKGAKVNFIHSTALKQADKLKNISRTIRKSLREISGVIVEDKGLALGIHYRMVSMESLPRFRALFRKRIRPICAQYSLIVKPGKKVFEIKPKTSWDKGSAVQLLKKRLCPQGVTIFLGDDATDEDAFRAMKANDIAIRVGQSRTSKATYYLRRQSEVPSFLKKLVSL